MINGKKFSQLEIILLVSAIMTLVVVASSVAYSLEFISTNLWRAIASAPIPTQGPTLFDVEGFKQLDL
jgi:hypothetical protein